MDNTAIATYKMRYGPLLFYLACSLFLISVNLGGSLTVPLVIIVILGLLIPLVTWDAVRKGRKAVKEILEIPESISRADETN